MELRTLTHAERLRIIHSTEPLPYEQRRELKAKYPLAYKRFEATNNPWDKSGIKSKLPYMKDILDRSRPTTIHQLEAATFARGKGKRHLQELSYEFTQKCPLFADDERGLQEAMTFLWMRVFDQTWWGRETELLARPLIQMLHCEYGTARLASASEDGDEAVDIIVEHLTLKGTDTKPLIVAAYQIKPDRYFRYRADHADKKRNTQANRRFTERTGVQVTYLRESDIRNRILTPVPREQHIYVSIEELKRREKQAA